jgi:hypothetical protein
MLRCCQPQATLSRADTRRLGAGAVWVGWQGGQGWEERRGGKPPCPISCPSAALGLYREAVANKMSYLTEARPTRGEVKLWRRGVCRVVSRES